MANFTNLLLLTIAIQVVLTMTGIATIPGSELYNFVTHPSDWDSAPWSKLLSDIFNVVGIGTVIVGMVFFKNDTLIKIGLIPVFYSFGKQFITLYAIIQAQVNDLFAIMIVSPLVLIYAMTLLSWWFGRAD